MISQSLYERAKFDGGMAFSDVLREPREGYFDVIWVACFFHLKDWHYNHIFNPFWRMYLNGNSGHGIIFDKEYIPLEPEEFLLVPAHTIFETFSGPKSAKHLCLHFNINPHLVFSATKPFRPKITPASREMATRLEKAISKKTPDITYCHQLCLSLLHFLFAPIFASQPPQLPEREEVARVLRAIETDPTVYSHPVEMARAAGMSIRSFNRHFRQSAGKSPAVYLKETRLQEAARQLAATDQGIDRIAANLGFADRYHFSRLFRSYTGLPPAAFRKIRTSQAIAY